MSQSNTTPAPRATDLREYARQIVADWPPLTGEQREQLRTLLAPGVAALAERRKAAAREAAA